MLKEATFSEQRTHNGWGYEEKRFHPTSKMEQISELFQVVKVNKKEEVPDAFSKLPLGSIVYYPNIFRTDSIDFVINEPEVRRLPLETLRVITIRFSNTHWTWLKPEEIKERILANLQKFWPDNLKIYEDESKAEAALSPGKPYAVWAVKDKQMMGVREKADEFSVIFPSFPWLKNLEHLIGISTLSGLSYTYHGPPFGNYIRAILEERLAFYNSLIQGWTNHTYSSQKDASKLIKEQNKWRGSLPGNLKIHLLSLAFFRENEKLYMLYHFPNHPEHLFTTFIAEEEKNKITKDQEAISNDISLLGGHPHTLNQLSLFELTLNPEALQKISRQFSARRHPS